MEKYSKAAFEEFIIERCKDILGEEIPDCFEKKAFSIYVQAVKDALKIVEIEGIVKEMEIKI